MQCSLDTASSPNAAVPTKQFVWGSELDELLSYRRKNGSTWENYFVLHGGQDTAAKLVDSTGAVVEQYEYDPYGKVSVYVGSSTTAVATSSVGLPFLWKGVRLDPETGLLQMRNRYYSTTLGRFLSADPIGIWGDTLNMGSEYAYVGLRHLIWGDPYGLQAKAPPLVTNQHKEIGELTQEDYALPPPPEAARPKLGDGASVAGYTMLTPRHWRGDWKKECRYDEAKKKWVCTYKAEWKTTVVFWRASSWADPDPAVLSHEIGHVHIAAIVANGVPCEIVGSGEGDTERLAANAAALDCREKQNERQEQFKKDLNREQDKYDKETDHGRNEKSQADYQKQFDELKNQDKK